MKLKNIYRYTKFYKKKNCSFLKHSCTKREIWNFFSSFVLCISADGMVLPAKCGLRSRSSLSTSKINHDDKKLHVNPFGYVHDMNEEELNWYKNV